MLVTMLSFFPGALLQGAAMLLRELRQRLRSAGNERFGVFPARPYSGTFTDFPCLAEAAEVLVVRGLQGRRDHVARHLLSCRTTFLARWCWFPARTCPRRWACALLVNLCTPRGGHPSRHLTLPLRRSPQRPCLPRSPNSLRYNPSPSSSPLALRAPFLPCFPL
ncbi:hypothetical protein MRX96_051517 [Rhipicephalus microplus]